MDCLVYTVPKTSLGNQRESSGKYVTAISVGNHANNMNHIVGGSISKAETPETREPR